MYSATVRCHAHLRKPPDYWELKVTIDGDDTLFSWSVDEKMHTSHEEVERTRQLRERDHSEEEWQKRDFKNRKIGGVRVSPVLAFEVCDDFLGAKTVDDMTAFLMKYGPFRVHDGGKDGSNSTIPPRQVLGTATRTE